MNWPDLDASPEEIARRRINRAPLPLLATGVPWATIMLASITGTAAMVASAPILPPLAFYVGYKAYKARRRQPGPYSLAGKLLSVFPMTFAIATFVLLFYMINTGYNA